MEKRKHGKDQTKMSRSTPKKRYHFISGWKLSLFTLRFGITLSKYLLQKRKFPLFSFSAINLFRKGKIHKATKIPKLGKHFYTAVLGVPRWPSRAYDHMVANGGLNLFASGTPAKTQIDKVFLGISKKCNYLCRHCYEYPNLNEGESVPVELWQEVVTKLQILGTSLIILSGGEPMLRFGTIKKILESADKNISDFHIQTSGDGVTKEKASTLKKAGLAAVGISIDDFDRQRHDMFRNFQGAHKKALQAIEYFNEAGIFTYINLCLREDLIQSNGLWTFFEFVQKLDVGAIVLLEPKPCGRYFSHTGKNLLSPESRKIVTEFFFEVNKNKKYRNYPFVTYLDYYERPELLGCLMGGLSHFYINTSGDVQPCPLLQISFGNIMEEEFLNIFSRMRNAVPFPIKKECPSIHFAEKLFKANYGNISSLIPYKNIKKEWDQMYE